MEQVADAIARLAATYAPLGARWDEDALKLWIASLEDLPEEHVVRAIDELRVAPGTRPPSLGDIRDRAVENMLHLPSYAEAVEEIQSALVTSRLPSLPEPAHRAYRATGGRSAWRESESPTVLRAQFRELYASFRAEAIRAAREGRTWLDPARGQLGQATEAMGLTPIEGDAA